MRTISKKNGKNFDIEVKGNFHKYPDGTIFEVKEGKLHPTENSGGGVSPEQLAAAIAAYFVENPIPTELPAVTAQNNGDFLCVVNGVWAAATIPAAESNSFGGN